MTYLELAQLTVPGVPFMVEALVGALFQISMLLRIKGSQANTNVVRVAAYVWLGWTQKRRRWLSPRQYKTSSPPNWTMSREKWWQHVSGIYFILLIVIAIGNSLSITLCFILSMSVLTTFITLFSGFSAEALWTLMGDCQLYSS